jgi:exopolyphosphatase/guanosine-5'-triphosphate,3'-diphosphate pyrophosphatase
MTSSSVAPGTVISAADLGTNTIKITHALVQPDGSVQQIRESADTIRLGKAIEQTGRIEPSRIDACLAFLTSEEQVGRQLGSSVFVGVATEALRVAANGAELLDRVHMETGWKIRLISGDEEARLTYMGLKDQLPDRTNVTIVDIGGGSTEIVRVANDSVVSSQSVPLGSGRLADQFFREDPPGLQALMDAAAMARERLDHVGSLEDVGDTLLFAGGNGVFVQTLADQLFPGEPLLAGTVEKLLLHFASTPAQDTADRLGIVRERARVLPAGAAIAFAFLLRTEFSHAAGLPSGIRIGLIREYGNRE